MISENVADEREVAECKPRRDSKGTVVRGFRQPKILVPARRPTEVSRVGLVEIEMRRGWPVRASAADPGAKLG